MKLAMAFAVLVALAPRAAPGQAFAPDPANPSAPVPAAKYESVFGGYRGFREAPLAPWRGVNDDVARAGGHIGILRGAGRHAPITGVPPGRPSVPPSTSAPGAAHGATHR